ncbi:hypothetical protein [Conexibacter sp. CPCC 206217]|uniref:IS1096 element passenger TnpR family protein n=1 Tax=Conexibacter sp. CPCC 206217 TaxID=3064574 RepID=UPI002723A905|nr:hypothetical protein [Conexibacter sp. CPCC 206217]MDO8213647.1 hypothetical protein [Conexibacter sp. CPCC 206217]
MPPALTFHAKLENAPRVSAWVAVRDDQDLIALHTAIQEAFGWEDDHEPTRTADVSLASLPLAVGSRIAYVFDFGDEWRVRLTLRATEEDDGGDYPRVVRRLGEVPPQHPDDD